MRDDILLFGMSRAISLVLVLVLLPNAGCYRTDPRDAVVVSKLEGLAEHIGINERGNVVSIDLTGSHVTDAHLGAIAELQQLDTLSLIGTGISDQGIAQLAALPNLSALSLAWTSVTDDGLHHLKNIESLRVLDLRHTEITDVGLDVVKKMPDLRQVFLEGTKVSDERVRALRRELPNAHVQQ